MKRKKQIVSLVLCLCLVFSLCPQMAAAEGLHDSGFSAQTEGLCEHHPQHTDQCGYTEGDEETPCTFVCEICNPQASGETEGAGTEEDPATPGSAIDSAVTDVQALIDALPTAEELESMSQDEQGAVYEQVQTAYDAYNALTDEQKAQVTGADIFDALFAVFNGMTNALATTNNVSYLDEDGNQQEANNVTVVDSSTTSWNTGWYVVNSNVTISDRITVSGDVNLILADGYTLTASQGITVTGNNSLTIYGQAGGTGTLTATTTPLGAAGIGGGFAGAGGTITINGGTVEATGGSSAAGIGGGMGGVGGTITINGGTVTATGGSAAAGIGGGMNGAGGTITISGGTVTATGGSEGTGGAGIGGGSAGAGGSVTITGGTITAVGKGTNGKGIGNSSDYAGNGTCSISGSAVVFAFSESSSPIGNTSGSGSWNGIVFQGDSGQVYGNVTLEDDLTIPSGSTLTVPAGSTLTIPEGVTVDGSITNNGTVNNSGTVTGGITGGTVNVPSTVSVTVTPSPATYGSTVSITANISQASSNALTRAANQVEFFVGTGNSKKSLGTAAVSNNTAILSNVSVTTDSGWALGNNTITAEYGGGSGLLENSGTATLTVNAIPLAAPMGLAWSTITPGQATWSAVTNASGYDLQLYKDGSAQGSTVTASGTSYDFASTITQAGSYTFTVTATGSGAYSDSSASSPSAALYTVSFDTNGGTGAIPMQLVPNGNYATEPTTAPTRIGHSFDGWYRDSGLNTAWNFESDTVTAATTLYAKWTPLTYKVTLKAGDGTINNGNVIEYTYGVGAMLPTAENMTYTGHDFKGWYESSDFSSSQVTTISTTDIGDKTYYAKWEASTYEVTLNTNGGSINDGYNVTEYTYGEGATLPTAQNMTYTGHDFGGWYDNQELTGDPVTAITDTDTGEKTYYAKWTASTYKVTLETNDGNVNNGNVTEYTYGEGAMLPTDVTREGYAFAGWYEDSNFSGSEVTTIGTDATGAKIYYAKWLSTDAGVKSVVVDEKAGELNGTQITVTLPFGSTLPDSTEDITITPADGATYSTPTMNAGTERVTYSFTVTAEDGTTQAEYTVTVTIAPDPAAENRADVNAAKAAVDSHTWTVSQATANTEEAVKTWIEGQLAGLAEISQKDVDYTVSITDFTAAVGGTAADRDGTNGSFTFTVILSKGNETGNIATSTYAEARAETRGVVTASTYHPPYYPVTGITLDQTSLSLEKGSTATLHATVTPAYATNPTVTWSSSDTAVATVDRTGTVTAVGGGTAVITASAGNYSATCTVTVPITPSPTALTVTGRTTSSVTLSWDGVEEAEGYTIWYRSEYETEVTRKIIWDGDTTTWTKTGLEPGTKYFFAIRSWVTDADGKYVFSEVSPTQRGTTKPEAAQIQSVTVSNGYVKVRMAGEARGAKRYSICYADSRNGFTENNFLVGIRTSYTVRTMTPQLEPGTYYICVKSYRDLGNSKRIYGNWSNIMRVTVR